MANILANLDGWDIIPANNQPDGLDPMTVVDDLRQIQATVKKYLASKGSNIASASTVDLTAATGFYVEITGTTPITSFGTMGAGISKLLKFTGDLTLTYHATSMLLPTSASIAVGAGDTALAVSLGSGNWQILFYQRASGLSLTFPSLVGYFAGNGGTVTQSGTKYNPITLNELSGMIQTDNASMVANERAVFTLNNSQISATDCVIINIKNTFSGYSVEAKPFAGGAVIILWNWTGSTLAESVQMNFSVIKGSTT